MYLTEDKAKKKWCPFVRLADGPAATNQVGYNRLDSLKRTYPINSTCITSACMAWRKAGSCEYTHNKGYCDLAGK